MEELIVTQEDQRVPNLRVKGNREFADLDQLEDGVERGQEMRSPRMKRRLGLLKGQRELDEMCPTTKRMLAGG
jgi:hypothetical protein